jgi:hypothetical protein
VVIAFQAGRPTLSARANMFVATVEQPSLEIVGTSLMSVIMVAAEIPSHGSGCNHPELGVGFDCCFFVSIWLNLISNFMH